MFRCEPGSGERDTGEHPTKLATRQDAEDVPSNRYEDIDVQRVISHLDTDAGQFTDSQEVIAPWQVFEPLGGLARDELAELVYLDVHAVVSADSVDNDGRYELYHEVSLDSDPDTFTILAGAQNRTDVNGVSGLDSRDADVIDVDIIDAGSTYLHSGLEDTTNGPGEGPVWKKYNQNYRYRQLLGAGPVLDRHSEVNHHIAFQITGNTSTNFQYRLETTFWWDVYDNPR